MILWTVLSAGFGTLLKKSRKGQKNFHGNLKSINKKQMLQDLSVKKNSLDTKNT